MAEKMKILVTGGAGFIGSHLTDRLLALGNEVICIDNFDPFYSVAIKRNNLQNALSNSNFHLVQCDIRNKTELEQCFQTYKTDLVVHLAAKAGVRPSIEDPQGYFDVNVTGTVNLLEVMRKHGITRMVFASSSSIYGNNSKVPFSETDAVDSPISPYAATKKACELLCYCYHHLFAFDIFCLRFFTVYGPRQRPDLAINKFTDNIVRDLPIEIFGDGNSSRDYTYVDDIVDGILSSIRMLKGYEIINLGESRTISLNRMIHELEKVLKKTAARNYLPMQPGDVNTTYADISKARSLLGYNPSMDFEDGILSFINWKLH
jgi:UDP-glucuronate 4-epimerase